MTFLFTLFNTTKGTSVLTHDPDGWDDVELIIRRDERFHGMFFDFSTTLGFFNNGGGREFIESVYDDLGIDEEVTIDVDIDCNESGVFETLYDGILNLASISFDRTYLRCNIEQSGITQTVLDRMDMKIDLSSTTGIDGTAFAAMTRAPYDLTLHSKLIFAESELDDNINSLHSISVLGAAQPIEKVWYQVPYALNKNELKETTTPIAYTNLDTAASVFSTQANNWFHDTTLQDPPLVPGTYNVGFDFTGTYRDSMAAALTRIVGSIGAAGIELVLFYGQDRFSASTTVLGTIAGYTTALAAFTQAISVVGSTTITINPGDKIWLMWVSQGYDVTAGVGPFPIDIRFDHSGGSDTATLTLDIDSTTPSSTCKAFAIYEAFAKIAQSITDQADAFRSNYFGRTNSQPFAEAANGCGSFTAVTTGYLIRKFTLANEPPSVSLNELFSAMNAIWNLGLNIEDGGTDQVIRVEPKNFYYNTTVLFQVANIDFLVTKVSEKRYINEIAIGYDKYRVDDINTEDEINIEQQRITLLKIIKQPIDAICSFIASGYAIEWTRRKRIDITTDWRYDKNNFVVCLNRSVDGGGAPDNLTTAEQDENYTSTTGLIDPATSYNLRISPLRNMLRWMYVVGAGLLKDAGANSIFTSGEANSSQVSTRMVDNNCPGEYNNVNIAEDADVAWDSANLEDGDVVWIPEEIDFDDALSFTDYKLARANPTRAIEYSEGSTTFLKGFILELRYKPVQGTATYKLLRENP